ncbi:T9SS type A sorting domain-containing protein [Pedobacter duraquae]|uniref:Putative secreted protein (Por secretion system target) n=1 Tax=Pedobacter duraquae TaxID=425511 RepID=A0A4R6IMI8_9SPHI|nr:T9SS type A sorting domain-containing protein [Pedobacter duraquae]TDO23165.1 putative secreted protein (Por secretion system target) [Pedobacter duraquae]
MSLSVPKIKILLCSTVLLLLVSFECSAQITLYYYRSARTGNWNGTNTWERSLLALTGYSATSTPPSSANATAIEIQAGHVVTVTATTDGKEVTVNGTLTINPSITFTIVDVIIVDDFTVSSTGTLNVNGTLQNPGGTAVINGTATVGATGIFNNTAPGTVNFNANSSTNINGVLSNNATITSTAATLNFNNGGSYVHQYTTTAGAVPIATWNDGSTCEFRGYTTSGTVAANLNQSLYNVRWNCASQSVPIQVNSASGSIRGDLIVNTSGSSNISFSGYTFTAQRDYLQTGGTVNLTSTTGNTTMNIGRNFSQSAGTLNLTTGTGNAIYNVAGNFTMTGGTLNKGTGAGTGNFNFNGTTRQIFTKSLPATAVITGALNFTVNANAIVDFNTSILDGSTGTFTLSSTGTLITANTQGIAQTGGSGSIQSTGTRSFSQTANYWYDTNVAQITGSGLPVAVNNLTVSKVSSGVTLTPGTQLTVNGILTMTSGFFDLTTVPLLLGISATTAGTGMLITQNTSALPIPTGKTWTFGVTYNANAGSQTLVPGTFGGLTMSNAAVKNGQPGALTITGDWNSSGGKLDFTTNSTAVTFSGAGAQTITDTGSDGGNGVFFNSLTVSGSGTKTLVGTTNGKFSITPTGLLSMSGTAVLAAGGVLYLKSSAAGTANVGQLSGTSITGIVNAETFLTGGGVAANRGTRMLSASVTASTIYSQLKNTIFITGPGGAANGFDPGGTAQPFAVTLTKYVESRTSIPAQSQFQNVLTLSEAAPAAGNCFFVFFRGARDASGSASSKLNLPYGSPENVVTNFAGSLNQGSIPVSLSYTPYPVANNDGYDGYNAVGNPYPSAINWVNVTRTANIDNMVTVIRPGGGMTTYSAGVVTNAAPVLNGPVPGTSTTAFIIQPGQGFYVKARATGQTLTFTEGAKVTTQSPNRLLDAPDDSKVVVLNKTMDVSPAVSAATGATSEVLKVLKISLKDATNTDETALVFKQGYQDNYGTDDATYFSGSTISLASLTSDKLPMAINFMPELTSSTEIKLSVNATATGPVSLNFNDISGVDGKIMSLKDSYLNTTTKVAANGAIYNFSIDRSIPASFGTERFTLIFEDEKLPPAALLSFTAEKEMSSVKLKWMAASSTLDTFVVERSVEGTSFSQIATMAGGNISTKTFVDQKPLSGKNYYRIVQVDDLNHKTYSPSLMVNFEDVLNITAKASFTVYPNPVVNEIHVALKEKGPVQVNVYNLTGRLLTQKAFGEDDTVSLDVSTLMKGMHVLEVKSAGDNSVIGTSKFFKN